MRETSFKDTLKKHLFSDQVDRLDDMGYLNAISDAANEYMLLNNERFLVWSHQCKNGDVIEIREGDIVNCYDDAAKDPTWSFDKEHVGIIEYAAPVFVLKIPGKLVYDGGAVRHFENSVYLEHWYNAENMEVITNIKDSPNYFDHD